MADISEEELRKEIHGILKGANWDVMSAKKVRQQLEEKLDCNLISRKKDIDQMVMEYVNEHGDGSDEEENDDDDEEDENDKKKGAKRPAPPAKKASKPAKKAKGDSSEGEDGESGSGESEEEEDFESKKPLPKKKTPAKKKKKGSDSDSDSDWGKGEKKKAGGKRGKGGGYTKAKKLSPALASLMGEESMPRHEVVKRMWAMIKERNLYDPNNKQFAICDDDLYKVIGVKRFRTFGMMKYLKSHFHD